MIEEAIKLVENPALITKDLILTLADRSKGNYYECLTLCLAATQIDSLKQPKSNNTNPRSSRLWVITPRKS
jgi:hypothetical protein